MSDYRRMCNLEIQLISSDNLEVILTFPPNATPMA
jgi:hypothetical protein